MPTPTQAAKNKAASGGYARFSVQPTAAWPHSLFARILGVFLAFALLVAVVSLYFLVSSYRELSQLADPAQMLAWLQPVSAKLLSALAGIALVAAFVLYRIAKSINAPISELMRAMKKVASGDFTARIHVARRDELGALARFFNSMTDKIQKTQERSRELAEMKSQFVTVAAHQLRTPLSAIKWTLQIFLGGDAGTVTTEQRQLLQQADDTNEYMIGLVNSLLDTARIEEGKLGFNFRKVSLLDCMRKVVEQVRPATERAGLTIAFAPPAHDVWVIADPERLELAVSNILDNAVHYSKPQGHIAVTISEEKGLATVSIEDNGIGIPVKDVSKICTRFFRAANAILAQANGSGLGLFIARNIIEHHHGKMWFTSREGEGTTFFFSLPTAQQKVYDT